MKQSLRRLKPERRLEQLSRRTRSEFTFLSNMRPPYPKLLLDSTVYIDVLQGRLADDIALVLSTADLWHSSVTESELALLAGLLDPGKAGTESIINQIMASIDQRQAHRILVPDRESWREAGILAGILARLQRYSKPERRKALSDALLFLSAAKFGCSVLTRNYSDFDFLMQLERRGNAIFYEI